MKRLLESTNFESVSSNRIELLAAVLGERLKAGTNPFTERLIILNSKDMAEYLRSSIAASCGLAMGIHFATLFEGLDFLFEKDGVYERLNGRRLLSKQDLELTLAHFWPQALPDKHYDPLLCGRLAEIYIDVNFYGAASLLEGWQKTLWSYAQARAASLQECLNVFCGRLFHAELHLVALNQCPPLCDQFFVNLREPWSCTRYSLSPSTYYTKDLSSYNGDALLAQLCALQRKNPLYEEEFGHSHELFEDVEPKANSLTALQSDFLSEKDSTPALDADFTSGIVLETAASRRRLTQALTERLLLLFSIGVSPNEIVIYCPHYERFEPFLPPWLVSHTPSGLEPLVHSLFSILSLSNSPPEPFCSTLLQGIEDREALDELTMALHSLPNSRDGLGSIIFCKTLSPKLSPILERRLKILQDFSIKKSLTQWFFSLTAASQELLGDKTKTLQAAFDALYSFLCRKEKMISSLSLPWEAVSSLLKHKLIDLLQKHCPSSVHIAKTVSCSKPASFVCILGLDFLTKPSLDTNVGLERVIPSASEKSAFALLELLLSARKGFFLYHTGDFEEVPHLAFSLISNVSQRFSCPLENLCVLHPPSEIDPCYFLVDYKKFPCFCPRRKDLFKSHQEITTAPSLKSQTPLADLTLSDLRSWSGSALRPLTGALVPPSLRSEKNSSLSMDYRKQRSLRLQALNMHQEHHVADFCAHALPKTAFRSAFCLAFSQVSAKDKLYLEKLQISEPLASCHMEADCKNPIFQESHRFVCPPLEINTTRLSGSLYPICSQGLIFAKEDTLEDAITVWPEALSYFCLCKTYNLPWTKEANSVVFLKSSSFYSFSIDQPFEILEKLLHFYDTCRRFPCPLNPSAILAILHNDKAAVAKALTIDDLPLDHPLLWYKSRSFHTDPLELITRWSCQLKLIYRPLLDAFHVV